MCGIAGYYGLAADEALLRRMNNCQQHRGPDGEGYFLGDGCGLAHRRLSIIDVAHGDQPMTTADGRHTIVYNGELYNYLDLRAELQSEGREFRTDSDTEVVLQAYAAWGPAAFDRFNGMFAIAIWDSHTRSLTLARDHFGIKPLYLVRDGAALLFGSEIKPLLQSGHYDKRPNERTIYRYLRFRIHEDGTETFFDGIERLQPGEFLIVGPEGQRRDFFSHLPEELLELGQQQRPFDESAVAEYRAKLIESIRLRLQSEVPVGTSLSGGLDSSTVAVIINELLNEGEHVTTEAVGAQQNTFSAVFPKSINDEERYVDEVLDICKGHVDGHKIRPTTDDFKADLADFVRTQEEPLISSGPYAQFAVMREASQYVTVLLDGQGADEMMAGYNPYYYVYWRQLRAQDPKLAAAELASSRDIAFKLARSQATSRLRLKKHVAITDLINPTFAAAWAGERFEVENDNLKRRLVQDLFHNSLPSLLRYEDKNTMRFSLEGRVPFLDKEVVKFLFSLSDDAIIHDGWNKRILRDATRGLLPESINRRRNKIGFTTPEVEWFERLKNFIYEVFSSESFRNRPYFNGNAVAEAFEGWIQNRNDTTTLMFWRFLNLELWLREFFDEHVEADEPVDEVTKSDYVANAGKDLTIDADGATVCRYPVQTDLFAADDDLDARVLAEVADFVAQAPEAVTQDLASAKAWYFFISEKIVAITQGRSYFTWDIKVSPAARVLSKFVTRTPAGIGLGSPYTMQLAIQDAGLPRIAFAAAGGAVGKLIGRKGLFYELAGNNVRAIDGPTEYSVYPANVSAKLAPKDPDDVAARLTGKIRAQLPDELRATFGGSVIMDANDIGRNVLGHDTAAAKEHLEAMFADNPLGQGSQRTPMAIVVERA